MSAQKMVGRRADPKPCPRCYAPMRLVEGVYECVRHGAPAAPEPARPVRKATVVERPVLVKVARSRVRRAKPRKVQEATRQTRALEAMSDTIVARNQAGETLTSIAADLWRQLGYKDAHVAASKISRFLRRRGIEVAEARTGPPPGTRAAQRYSDQRLAEVRDALDAGVTVWAFAGTHWQEWGFTSRGACDSLILDWLRRPQ